MGSNPMDGNPKPWVPYINTKDCSQGFCSLYCPQWCYIVFPPPQPPLDLPDDGDGLTFSPIVIAVIGILASAFLLVSYYAMISKYCKNRESRTSRSRGENGFRDHSNSNHDDHGWNTNNHHQGNGVEEGLIKSIKVFKYKKGDHQGLTLTETSDCSVCLSEFQDGERLRLLPKCSHAFHVNCIDVWFKSHSNCPLCRANVSLALSSDPEPGSEVLEEDLEMGRSSGVRIRRSLSMDCLCEGRLSVADVLRIDQDEDEDEDEDDRNKVGSNVGGSKWPLVGIRRSFSSGRLSLAKAGTGMRRGRSLEIPL